MASTKYDKKQIWLALAFAVFFAVWAIVQAWGHRFEEYGNDGISYLDMAEYFAHFDIAHGFTCYWSPLYPLVIAGFLQFLHPHALGRFALLKLVNASIYVALIVTFELFLYQFIHFYRQQINREQTAATQERSLAISDNQWMVIGNLLFAYGFFVLGGSWIDTPDALFMTLFVAAVLVILQVQSDQHASQTRRMFVAGILLGLAYLAKSVMLPIAAVLLFAVWLYMPAPSRNKCLVSCVLGLLIVSIPYVSYLSFRAGEPTLASSGKINYIWYVSRTLSEHEQGLPALRRQLRHPEKQIFATPSVFEFANTVNGTYPPWFDPAYFYAGATMSIRPLNTILVMTINSLYFLKIYFAAFFLLVCILWCLCGTSPFRLASIKANAILTLPCLAAFAIYCVTTNLAMWSFNDRHFSVFVVIFSLGALASLRLRIDVRCRRGLTTLLCLTSAICGIAGTVRLVQDIEFALSPPDLVYWKVAETISRLGIHPGTKVARLGDKEVLVDWAKLANLRIVADIPNSDEFFKMSPERRAALFDTLKKSDVEAIIYFPEPISHFSQGLMHHFETEFFSYLKLLGAKPKPPTTPPFLPNDNFDGWLQVTRQPCYIHRL